VAKIFLEAKAKCTKVHSFKLYLGPIKKKMLLKKHASDIPFYMPDAITNQS
jgi:hypothetical protein